jgi:hypothetical protein
VKSGTFSSLASCREPPTDILQNAGVETVWTDRRCRGGSALVRAQEDGRPLELGSVFRMRSAPNRRYLHLVVGSHPVHDLVEASASCFFASGNCLLLMSGIGNSLPTPTPDNASSALAYATMCVPPRTTKPALPLACASELRRPDRANRNPALRCGLTHGRSRQLR